MFQWIWANREWVLSGAGVALIVSLVGWVTKRNRRMYPQQSQTGGHESLNLQAGRDISIGEKQSRRD